MKALSPVVLAAVHAALGTLAQQLAASDGGAVQSPDDPIVFLALPAAVKAIRFRRLAAEIKQREERSGGSRGRRGPSKKTRSR